MSKHENLDRFLKENGFDAFIIYDKSENPNQYYLTQFEASHPFLYLRKDKESTLLSSQLEYSRAKEEAQVDHVISVSKYTKGKEKENGKKPKTVLQRFIEDQNIEKLAVPEDFPLKKAEDLKKARVKVESIPDKIIEARKKKNKEEIQKLRRIQEYNEKAMRKARKIIEKAEIKDNKLYFKEKILTSEKLRSEIKNFLVDRDCELPEETIVSSGKESAKPHARGKGPIKPNEPIIIDIIPRRNHYFGDMTRTFVKGDIPQEVEGMYEAVLEAQEEVFKMLENGSEIKANDLHNRVCEVLERNGYKTPRKDEEEPDFMHSTGHGVGLEIHEKPKIANNEDILEPRMVVTIEPGLYLPRIGGVRLEDMILIKENGYENLNKMSKDLGVS